MAKIEIVSQRLQQFNEAGSLGLVTDTIYIRCFWPKLDQPTALFAEGSSRIEVEGPPTPRNVVFPPDTVFRDGTRGDCFFLRHKELVSAAESKPRYAEYVAEMSSREAADLVQGKADSEALKSAKDFVAIDDSPLDANATRFTVARGAVTEKGK